MSCCHAQCASRLRSNPRFSQMPDPETLLDVQKCSSSKACSFWILGESLNIFDMGSGWIRNIMLLSGPSSGGPGGRVGSCNGG